MPVKDLISSFTDKAQNVLQGTPLAQHLPGRASSPDSAAQPAANEAAAGHGHQQSHNSTITAIQHQLRSLGQQYSSATTPIQRIITSAKGTAIDFDSAARDAKAQSKELYTWGQTELDDLKDVTDRLAYLTFVQGSLASSLAVRLDAARAPMKALRDAENALTPKRNIRAGLNMQLARLEHDNQKGNEKKIAELREHIKKVELEDQPQEREIDLLKRKAVRDSATMQWDAMREYAEKLVLLSQTATPIIKALPLFPPSIDKPYEGRQATGAARASLQRALDNYKTGHIHLPDHTEGSDLSRSDTRSFGESHASELSSISTDLSSSSTQPGIPLTPPIIGPGSSIGKLGEHSTKSSQSSAPIDPNHLNLAPAAIPSPASSASAIVDSKSPTAALGATPTIAETGTPVSAGVSGPGPVSGSLNDIRSPTAGQSAQYPSAEEEKKRLGQAYSQAYQPPPGPPGPMGETAAEEKRRIERQRQERESLEQAGTSEGDKKKGDEDLPPYQDI
ncbi:Eisosome component PIL1-domain-containing protein [Mycena floridula]|nr:Eisosome component PIL1-domain-containing protein [Mycena floridula]